MKFSDPGRMVPYDLKKYMEKRRKSGLANSKTTTGPKLDGRKKIEKSPKSDVHKKIEKNFKFEAAREFLLDGGVLYSPDYILTKKRNEKKIIIHVDMNAVDANVSMYNLFMKMFRNAYHVIMVVSDGQLRAWNEKDKNRHILFDEIWTVDDVNDMIESVKNSRGIDLGSDLAACSICHRQIKGAMRIKSNFAYRTESDGLLTIQPYCRKCQKKVRSREVNRIPESTIRCIGCGVLFRTKIGSQIYCNPCDNSLTS